MNGEIYYHPNLNHNLDKTHRTNIVQVRCVIYTPPGYDSEKGGTCPVLYLLHGVGDIEYSWELYGKASRILDGLLAENAIPPIFVVMPFGFESNEQKFLREFPDKDWFDGQMLRVREVVELAYKLHLPVTADTRLPKRAIAGLSMGGKQALEFGLNHLELFSAIGNFSGAIQKRSNADPLSCLIEVCGAKQAELNRLALFYHACGRDDETSKGTLVEANQKFVDLLTALRIPHETPPREGKHEWTVWRACLKEFLTLLGKRWQRSELLASG
jgi:enterochelin esterase-like enzyme